MNRSWFIYHGHMMNMSRDETMTTRYGEFLDLMACDAIMNGKAKYKRPKKKMNHDEMLKVR